MKRLLLALLLSLAPLIATAQYPTRTITVIVPYPPGGGTDIVGRYIFTKMKERLGWHIIIDNKSGATGVVGTRAASSAPNDGYTLLLGHIAPNAINPGDFMAPVQPVDWALVPVGRIATAPAVLLARKETGIKTLADFHAWVRNNPVVYGSDGIGSLAHLQMFSLLDFSRVLDPVHIPYKGGAPALHGLMTGDVPILISPVPVAIGFLNSGYFNVIAQTGDVRLSVLPVVPTLGEQGSPFTSHLWWGMYAPVGTPKDIIERWSYALREVLKQPEVIAWLAERGYTPAWQSPSDFGKFADEETRRWKQIVNKIPK